MKHLIFFIFIFFLIGCTDKYVTVKSLQPSLIANKKINKIILEQIKNDYINQADHLEQALFNKTVNGKKVFELKPTYKNIDAIITGKVLNSSLDYDFYYEIEENKNYCLEYEYIDNKRTNNCIRYKKYKIPCEKRYYKVKTQIQVLDEKEYLLFSKVYSKNKTIDKCFENRRDYSYFNFVNDRQRYEINTQLAKEIAYEAVDDISPYYEYFNITIIEELNEEKKYYKTFNNQFKSIVKLLDNQLIYKAQNKLNSLNQTLQKQSYEVLYNLALTYEVQNKLFLANKFYNEARDICENIEHLKLIEMAIFRTKRNIENEQKAKYQLN